jgi:hypothetical protein
MTINATPEPITIYNDPLEEVKDFTYLGSHVFYQILLVLVSSQSLQERGRRHNAGSLVLLQI